MEKSLLKLEHGDITSQDGFLDDEFQGVEFELISPTDISDENRVRIKQGLSETEKRLAVIDDKVAELNSEIDVLTNHADGFDYAIAVTSGLVTGMIDSLFVGEWDFKAAKGDVNEKVNKQITDYAKKCGYNGVEDKDGNIRYPLPRVIKFLEDNFSVDQDNTWKDKGINVSATSHHLDDLAHHPTPIGLVSAIIVQFLRAGIFINRNGKWYFEKVDTEPKELIKTWTPVLLFGLTTWIVNIIEKKNYEEDCTKIPELILKLIKEVSAVPMMITILKVANNWYGHLMSDKAGTKKTAGGGMGIPGLTLSLLKEFSMIPGLIFPAIPQNLAKLYEKGIGTGKGQVNLGIFNCLFEGDSSKFDARTEEAIGCLLGKQAIPVIINEVLVRGFYFIRHFTEELKRTSNISEINWSKTRPFGNRTVVRMMTIASGTFTAVDLMDAGIRTVVKSGSFILRVNFVGVGRFAVAITTDSAMGIKKGIKENKRLDLIGEQLKLMNVKVSYKQADMWISAKDAGETIKEAYQMVVPAIQATVAAWESVDNDVIEISSALEKERTENAMLEELLKMLE